MDITSLTLDQLEALAYRLVEGLEQTKSNLSIVQQQIMKLRSEAAPAPVGVVPAPEVAPED